MAVNIPRITELIIASQNGSEVAFNELYTSTRGYVYNTIYEIIKIEETSEDLVQETFLKILQSKMKTSENGFSYLLTVAKNLALNVYRRRKREVPIDFEHDETIYRIDSQDDKSNFDDLIIDLTTYQKLLIQKHIIEGMTHKEIAKELNKPIGTIMWQYNEALKILRKLINQ